MTKARTYAVDPRDESGPRTRRTMDERGASLYVHPPINEYDALMRCAPHADPVEFDHNVALAGAIADAMESLTYTERVCWESNPTPVREVAERFGFSKSTVQRARVTARLKLQDLLVDWVRE